MRYGSDTLISQLPLRSNVKKRIVSCLLSINVRNVGELLQVSRERLMNIRDFGRICYAELRNVMADDGFFIKEKGKCYKPAIDLKNISDDELMGLSNACNREIMNRRKALSILIREARKEKDLTQAQVVKVFANDCGDKIKVFENQFYHGKLRQMRHLLACLEDYEREYEEPDYAGKD